MAAEDIAQQRAVPPHDLMAEQAVLGAILFDNSALGRISLAPEDFYNQRHVLIFYTMQRMAAASIPIDEVTLHDALKTEPEPPPASYIAELVDCCPSAANVRVCRNREGNGQRSVTYDANGGYLPAGARGRAGHGPLR